jgi:hypothetical protein
MEVAHLVMQILTMRLEPENRHQVLLRLLSSQINLISELLEVLIWHREVFLKEMNALI